ncbi:uncharacterized protein EDB91DRAFT_1051499 [Suillus paluster]|uniref:uncharacterized protein n=1 Tax=Suillus paluster TaxID=48578 RepID=UPI001B870C51|nr:uncharacterized protein EDB91DRAFT_1051499 [Suillus paluster]KAG1743256.1 hypothetical protein EDB91DRAFT_1051499 [Suillus paluster]
MSASSTIISFPGNSTTTTSTGILNETSTVSLPSTHMPTTTNSDYQYLSTISSLLVNTATSTSTVVPTNVNPDVPTTTLSLASAAPTSQPSAAPFPTYLPQFIVPQTALNTQDVPTSDVMVSVLFNQSLNWVWVATNSDTPGQIFEYFPQVIATALGIDVSVVLNYQLMVYEPSTYTGPQDASQLGTIWEGYIPSNQVSTLASLISNKKSSFYTGQEGSIPTALAECVDPTLDLSSISGPTPGGSSSSSSSSSTVRQDAIIGVVTSLGAIALIILAVVVYRYYKRRQEVAHRRLSEPDGGAAGVRPEGQEFDRDSIGGQRRRSFYYAEDSLRGYQGVRRDDEAYDRRVTPAMRERRILNPGAISAPILRESSMNW